MPQPLHIPTLVQPGCLDVHVGGSPPRGHQPGRDKHPSMSTGSGIRKPIISSPRQNLTSCNEWEMIFPS
jgi:hypothetical protein